MDNIQLEINEKNKKVSFNNNVQIKTIPNNDQNKELQNNYSLEKEEAMLKQIYGNNLNKQIQEQKKILLSIKQTNMQNHINNLNMGLAKLLRNK